LNHSLFFVGAGAVNEDVPGAAINAEDKSTAGPVQAVKEYEAHRY
jgi:hypothetical protein